MNIPAYKAKKITSPIIVDGGDCYYELEVNAAGTIYEVFFIWRDAFTYDRSGATFWKGNHPRGVRWK